MVTVMETPSFIDDTSLKVKEKILTEQSDIIPALIVDRCQKCHRWVHQACTAGVLPLTSTGEVCPYYMPY